jgi:hypothetical protein
MTKLPPNGPTLVSSTDQPAATPIKPSKAKPVAIKTPDENPPVTFSPEKLAELINMVTNQGNLIAQLLAEKQASQAKTVAVETAKGKVDKAVQNVAAKSEKTVKNELETVRAFKKQLGVVAKPRVDTFTFNLWLAKGYRPLEGSKAVRPSGCR